MNRTTRTLCLSAAFVLASLLSSLALAQSHSLDSATTHGWFALVSYATPVDDSACRLPRSMVIGLSDLQAYTQSAEVKLPIDVDEMAVSQCTSGFTLANPKDASWTLDHESRARLSGLGSELQSWSAGIVAAPIGERGAASPATIPTSGRRTSTNTLLSIVR
jgi:hypothetical protein